MARSCRRSGLLSVALSWESRSAVAGFLIISGLLAVIGQPVAALMTLTLGAVAFGGLVALKLRSAGSAGGSSSGAGWFARRRDPANAALRRPFKLGISIEAIDCEEQRLLVRRILATHERIRCRLIAADTTTRSSLLGVYQRCGELASYARPLVNRGRDLELYLTTGRAASLKAELAVLDVLAESTEGQARCSYLAAARGKHRHLRICRDLDGTRHRLRGQLELIEASLEVVEAYIVLLASQDAELTDPSTTDVADLLDSLELELAEMASSVQTMLDE